MATISLDQPDTRNALSDELLDALIAAFARARDDDAVRAVVLASTHATVFSAGGNLSGFAADVPLVHKHAAIERFPSSSRRSARSASRRCARRAATCSRARSASPWPATS